MNNRARGEFEMAPAGTLAHGSKINWLTSIPSTSERQLVVADQTEQLTVYTLR